MPTYQILEAFHPKSLGRLVCRGEFVKTEDEATMAELKKFEADGSCKELVVEKKADVKPEEKTPDQNPSDDITVVPGVGKATVTKLAEAKITTQAELKAALSEREEELKGILGKNFDKVKEFFSPAE